MYQKNVILLLLVCLTFTMTGCDELEGDTGAPGPEGVAGAAGADGADGVDGADGINCWDL
ncbi:MAG: hypothetical protein HUJ31_01110, partial [Pseudomonadales bacterium]|nr:hypothetical protein [Pseudomonadales bacterium]